MTGDDPIARQPSDAELLEWISGLLHAVGGADAARQVTAVARRGRGTITISERDLVILIEGLRAVAEDPDMYFVDPPDGLFAPHRRYWPERALALLHADELRPAELAREVRADARRVAKERTS